MKNFFSILKYARFYKRYALLNIVFNLLSILFSLVSLTMIIPLLDLIFEKDNAEYLTHIQNAPSDITFSMTSFVPSLIDNFYYYFSQIILDPNQGKLTALLYLCILVVVLMFLKNMFRYLALYYITPLRNGVMRDLRNSLYEKILVLSLAYYSEEKKGDIIARVSNDAQEVEWSILNSLEMLFKDPLAILFFLFSMLYLSPQLTFFVLILLPITGILIGRVGKSLKRTSVLGQQKMGDLIAVIEETLSGLRIIKAFNAEKHSMKRFSILNESYRRLMVKMYRKRDLSAPMSEFLGVAVMVIVMWFGGKIVLSNELSAPAFIYYIVLFSQLIPPAKSLTTAYYYVLRGTASADRISKVLDAPVTIKEKANAKPINEFKNEIEYRNVHFTYDTEPVLNNINLTIEKGKTIALIGPSGGGKSTLVDLLPRFYDCTKGNILIDGHPTTDYKLKDLRGLMGIVTQESILFNDTILNNIAFGMDKFNKEDVIAAAKVANAHDFIMEMEHGYDTNIGDRGGKLSGGQRQRLSIARAVLKNPPILILDEATSSLDTESERLVQDAILKLMKNRTSIVIAHRLSTIKHADEIIVIDKGMIAERGKHADLILANGIYNKLFELQTFH